MRLVPRGGRTLEHMDKRSALEEGIPYSAGFFRKTRCPQTMLRNCRVGRATGRVIYKLVCGRFYLSRPTLRGWRFGYTGKLRTAQIFRICYRPLRQHAVPPPSSYQGQNGRYARQNVRPPLPPAPISSRPATNSLETLSSYVQSQRALLSRTQCEIERLNALKNEVKDEEGLTVGGIGRKVCFPATFCRVPRDQCVRSSVSGGSDWTRRTGWTWRWLRR